jgi:hypothetical protein
MVKYKEFFTLMVEQNREQFQKFMILCQDYIKDKKGFKEQFDREGREIRDIVEFWERKLCKQMEGGNKAVYSSNLADKFRAEVKKIFPVYDEIGVKRG